MQERWKLIIEYNGSPYSGWQRQKSGVPSVQQAVETALHEFCQQKITLTAAGRTDAGVHACGQVAHFDLDYGGRDLDSRRLMNALNAHLNEDSVAVVAAEKMPPEFHARFNAVNKLYRYRIVCRYARPVRDMDKVWHRRRLLDAAAMHEAAQVLVGQHDFTTFRDSQCQAKGPVKTLDRLDVVAMPYDPYGGVEIQVEAEGRSFLHHQVRNMVGSLALVGEGKWGVEDLRAALAARDRTKGGMTAPAEGLYLMRVDYPAK